MQEDRDITINLKIDESSYDGDYNYTATVSYTSDNKTVTLIYDNWLQGRQGDIKELIVKDIAACLETPESWFEEKIAIGGDLVQKIRQLKDSINEDKYGLRQAKERIQTYERSIIQSEARLKQLEMVAEENKSHDR